MNFVKKMRSSGFTLAEVLITLGIIGVISALTLPGLQNNVGTKSLETRTAKFYSILSQATEKFLLDNNLPKMNSDFISDENIMKYFKVNTKCDKYESCFAPSYSAVNKDTNVSIYDILRADGKQTVWRLQDGTVFSFNFNTAYFDINGAQKPNKFGYDMWEVRIKDDGTIDDIDTNIDTKAEDITNNLKACLNGVNGAAYGCFGHFLRNGFKFDY